MEKRYRDGVDGRFVSEADAAARPSETVSETLRRVDPRTVAERINEFEEGPDGRGWDEIPESRRLHLLELARVVIREVEGS